MTAADVVPAGFDFTDPGINEKNIPHDEFLALRKKAPVFWVEQEQGARDGMSEESGTGYWAVSKHADVAAVSKNSKDFSTAENGAIIRFQEGMLARAGRAAAGDADQPGPARAHRDPADHLPRLHAARDRRPRRHHEAARREDREGRPRRAARATSSRRSPCELPLQAIADFIGVPQEDRRKLFDWSNQMLSYDDPDVRGRPGHRRRRDPRATPWRWRRTARRTRATTSSPSSCTPTRTGAGLNDDEFGYFVIILTVAGNETTRNAITHGMNAFLDNPDQWELWKRERPDTMVDEVIRWATPVSSFQRTALNDVEVGGVQVKKGQRVGLFYASANFDDDVFDDPYTLRHHPRPQPARRVRRPRRALLHRRQPGPPGGQADVQRPRRPRPRHREGRPTRAGSAPAGSTASRTCRSSTPEARVCRLPRPHLAVRTSASWATWQPVDGPSVSRGRSARAGRRR